LTEDFIEMWSEPADDALDFYGMILESFVTLKNIKVYGDETRLPAGRQEHGHVIF
jgi:hypothetical protein